MIGLVYPNRALCNIIYSTDRKKLYSQKHSGLYSSEIRRFMLDQKLSCELLQICHTFGNEKPTYSWLGHGSKLGGAVGDVCGI